MAKRYVVSKSHASFEGVIKSNKWIFLLGWACRDLTTDFEPSNQD
jgi:hypothetical protein